MGILENSKTLVLVTLAVMGIVLATSGTSTSSSVDVWKKSAGLQDNTAKLDKTADDYISGDGGLDDSVKEVIANLKNASTNGSIIQDDVLVYNYSDDGLNVIITNPNNSTQSITIDKKDFDRTIDNVIRLDGTEQIIQTWKNSAFDLNGFTKDFEAILVKDITLDKYTLYYKIDTEKFVINDLKYIENGVFNGALNGIYTSDYKSMFGNIKGSPTNIDNIVSLIGIGKTNSNLEIIYSFSQASGTYGASTSGFCAITNEKYYKNPTRFYSHTYGAGTTRYYADYNWNIGNGCTSTSGFIKSFAINEYEEFSKDSIAVKTNSRTAGFDRATLVKQELSTGMSGVSDKYLKIVSEEDFNSIQTENTQFFTDFLIDRINGNIISAGLNNHLNVDSEPYSIGNSISGIIVDNGYIQNADLLNGSVEVVEQIKFNGENTKGLQFDDLGLVKLDGAQVEDLSFGNLKDNFQIQTHGTAYMVDRTAWEKALAVVWNVVTFDFAGVKQAWSNQAVNPIISDDKTTGNVNGDLFGYTQSFKTSGNLNNLVLNTQKPLTQLLSYNGDNYWLFYTLEASTGEKGCIIYDTLNSNLDVRMPVSTCGNSVAGTNSLSQFKIASD